MTWTTRKDRWADAQNLVAVFSRRVGAQTERLAILDSIWSKECGAFARHWALIAVKKGVLYVRPASAAAAQELHLRSGGLIRSLNKYFSRPWIAAVRITYR
ncbi:MAG: DUF721 domain-containing protein [Elusimicrobia bacterium]|nr:DUF721 domain-containing protein [Elusimicrobiota bacterium]